MESSFKKASKIFGRSFKDFVAVKGVENFQILITVCVSERLYGEMLCVGKVDEFDLAK